jgi:cell division septation protein DedD
VRSLRHKLWNRHGDPERRSFAFFVVGALVVIAVAMFLGFQLGRYAEKSAGKDAGVENAPQADSGDNESRIAASAEIRKDLSAFSEEAVKVPAVPPPVVAPLNAGDDLRKTESEATYPETLSRKDPSPQPMARKADPEARKPETTARKKEKAPAAVPSGRGKYLLQAGAMKTRDTAEAVRRRLDRGGFKAKVIRAATREQGVLYRVRVGPFGSREEAMKAMKAIKDGMKIDVILLQG